MSFKFPDAEIKFLKWYSKKTAEPLGSIYRKVTLDHFINWKKMVLINTYTSGSIGIKQLANLGGMTFNECLLLLKQNNIDPPYNELLDIHSAKVVEELYQKPKEKDEKSRSSKNKEG
ncbi:MAG: hypothetical protein KAT16_09125 [Candidatus Heimdallarchaeota archaeon]|nr:hypothetical protein [Candidatus Heimdallarchaeota archaeon]